MRREQPTVGKVKKQEPRVKQEHQPRTTNAQTWKQVDYDQISDGQQQSLPVRVSTMSQKQKPKQLQDLPLMVQCKQYLNVLKSGRKAALLRNPHIVNKSEGRSLHQDENIGLYLISDEKQVGTLCISPQEEALFQEFEMNFVILSPMTREEDK